VRKLFVANGLHVPPIAYKLRSTSDLIHGYPVTTGVDRLQPRDRLTVNFPKKNTPSNSHQSIQLSTI